MSFALPTDLGGIFSSLNNITFGDIASQVAIGALATTALAGAQSSAGQNALDPLHLVHKDGSQTVVGGKTMTSSIFSSLDTAGKAQVLAAGYTIING